MATRRGLGAAGPRPSVSRSVAAVAGVVGAGIALATTELAAALFDRARPSLIGAVASRLLVLLAGPLKNAAISAFGTNAKEALLVGIVIVALGCGALLGIVGRRYRFGVVAGLATFGLVGVLCARSDPLASTTFAAFAAVLGVTAGSVATLRLLDVASASRADGPESIAGAISRRQLLATAAFAVLAAGVASTAVWFRARVPAASARRSGTLPVAIRTTPVPPGASLAIDGLTPYVTPADRLYRIDIATFLPVIDLDSWRLRITGMVDHPASYSYDDLLALGLVEEPVTIACVSNNVGGHLIGNGRWRGVPLDALVGPAGVQAGATQLVGRSVDGFTVGIPIDVVRDGRVAMVAVGLNDDVLSDTHGFPARLIVAGLYGYASATKWLTELELTRLEDHDSFWVERGWDRDGSIVTQTRIDVPNSGQRVLPGTLVAAGVAWAPPTGVAGVEVQLDRNEWRPARLASVASANTWVQWTCEFSDVTAGDHLLAARASDRHGRVQTEATRPAEPSGATGYPYRGFTVG